MFTPDLFGTDSPPLPAVESLSAQSRLLRGFALAEAPGIVQMVADITQHAPFRRMVTPGGFTMSVAITNCGAFGWTSDRRGYRYSREDPQSGRSWPPLPPALARLAARAADEAGFPAFVPDACLINQYLPGTRMSLHQDKDERDMQHPIVSISLGLAAVFQWGGERRADKSVRVPVQHGDVIVWGGVDRLRFHGVLPLKPATHPEWGAQRINITLRRAG